ncbi:MAG: FHA domain-containing protein [Planctomycetes bacterium]|nr:FHA domain-containing protein [Planctomycetota bacterium]
MSAVRPDSSEPQVAAPPGCELLPVDDPAASPVPVKDLPFFLGRAGDCNLVLRGEGILSKHAKVRWGEGKYWISDLATYQGTYVNGEPILEVPLKDGDLIRIGPKKLSFRLVQPAPRAGAAGSQALSPELSAAVRAHAAGKRPSVLLAVPWWTYAAAAGSILLLSFGAWVHAKREAARAAKIAPVTLPPVKLVAGESLFVEILLPEYKGPEEDRKVSVGDPVIASVQAVPDGVVVEAINPGETKVDVRVPDLGPRMLSVTVSAPPDPFAAYPDLRGVPALGPAARVELAKTCLELGERHDAGREEVLAGRWQALEAYRKAILVLESLEHKPSLLDTARTKFDAVKKDLDARWEEHYFQMVQSARIGDRIKAQEEARILLQLFPERNTQRNSIARVYLDRLRK